MNVSAYRAASQLQKFQLAPKSVGQNPPHCGQDGQQECPAPQPPQDRSEISVSVPAVDPPPMPALSMSFDTDSVRIKPGQKVDLNSIDTAPPEGVPQKKSKTKRLLAAMHEQIVDLQRKLYSENKQSLLVF